MNNELNSKFFDELLAKNHIELPISIDTIEDMKNASKLISTCSSKYAYYKELEIKANFTKRELKRNKATKEEIEDAYVQEIAFGYIAEKYQKAYDSISRMITIKQQINYELRMTDGK